MTCRSTQRTQLTHLPDGIFSTVDSLSFNMSVIFLIMITTLDDGLYMYTVTYLITVGNVTVCLHHCVIT